jgi:alpha 1,3-glucosidase
MWTGDNLCSWEHMAIGIKMVLANGIAGMTFAGCKHLNFTPFPQI